MLGLLLPSSWCAFVHPHWKSWHRFLIFSILITVIQLISHISWWSLAADHPFAHKTFITYDGSGYCFQLAWADKRLKNYSENFRNSCFWTHVVLQVMSRRQKKRTRSCKKCLKWEKWRQCQIVKMNRKIELYIKYSKSKYRIRYDYIEGTTNICRRNWWCF